MRLPLRRLPLAGSIIAGRSASKEKAKGKRQKLKGKNKLPRPMTAKWQVLGLIRHFCLLPFAFTRSVHDYSSQTESSGGAAGGVAVGLGGERAAGVDRLFAFRHRHAG